MKSFILALIILALVLTFTIMYGKKTEAVCKELIELAEGVTAGKDTLTNARALEERFLERERFLHLCCDRELLHDGEEALLAIISLSETSPDSPQLETEKTNFITAFEKILYDALPAFENII